MKGRKLRSTIRSRCLIAAALLTGVWVAGCSRPSAPAAVDPRAQLNDIKVLNADILVINNQHLRLANAVAPQAIPNAHCWAEALAAHQTRLQVRSQAVAARRVEVTPTGGTDSYNRTFARVYLDGVDLGQQLLDAGAAVAPAKAGFDWCAPLSTRMDEAPRLNALLGVAP